MKIEYYCSTFLFFIISFIYPCNGFLTEYRNYGFMKTASFTTVFARRGRKNNTKNNNNVTVKKKRKRSNKVENNDVTIDDENIPIRKVFSYASLTKRKISISLIPKLVHITDKNYDQQRQQAEQQHHHQPKSSSCENFITRVSVYEINDPKWWSDSNANANPFGARLWPSSLGLSQFLVNFASLKKDDGMKIPMLNQYNILEVGSGTALPSIVAATLLTQHGEKGGEVIASDIDSTVLQLAMDGWTNTLKSIKKKDKDNKFSTVSFKCIPFDIKKSPKNFRLFLSENFETEEGQQKPTLILGTALFYDNTLAKKMAHVVVNEALSINSKSWIVIGNDDSSNRDGDGKLIFLQELKSLIPNVTIIESNSNSVQQEKLGWQEKQVKLMHINPPIDDDGGISESLLRCL